MRPGPHCSDQHKSDSVFRSSNAVRSGVYEVLFLDRKLFTLLGLGGLQNFQVEKIRESQKGAINARQLKFIQASAVIAEFQSSFGMKAPVQSYKRMTKPGPIGGVLSF